MRPPSVVYYIGFVQRCLRIREFICMLLIAYTNTLKFVLCF